MLAAPCVVRSFAVDVAAAAAVDRMVAWRRIPAVVVVADTGQHRTASAD